MIMRYLVLFSCMFSWAMYSGGPYPIQFSIPESKMISAMPQKERDFAFLIPWQQSTYIYSDEDTYRQDYQRSFLRLRVKKVVGTVCAIMKLWPMDVFLIFFA